MTHFYQRILFTALILFAFEVSAKDYFKNKTEFIEQNLKKKDYNIDTSATAVILYEKYYYDLSAGNNMITYKVRQVIKILKKGGIHYADIDVRAYQGQNQFTKIRRLYGTTYNLENGEVTEQQLDAENISSDSYEHIKEKKFSMPSVHEGSIIDYTFEIEHRLTRNFCTWDIEGILPKLYSETQVVFPSRFLVVTLSQNTHEFQSNVDEKVDSLLPDAYSIDALQVSGLIDRRFVRRNVPALSKEPYVYNINNSREQMLFFIKGFAGGSESNDYSWDKLNGDLFRSPEFYKAIHKSSKDIQDKVTELIAGETEDMLKAKTIYAYVRDSITVGKDKGILVKNYPAEVFNNKTGTVTEINMLLIDMLQYADINCSPVILSTRENGRVSALFPDINRFNYTICAAEIAGKTYYLDASGRYNPFGILPQKCYNGYARLINKEGSELMLYPDSAKETESYKITTENNSDTAYRICISFSFGDYNAIWHRGNWNADSAEIKDFISKALKNIPFDPHLRKYEVQNMKSPDSPLVLNIHVAMEWPRNEKMIYLNPFFHSYFSNNPFTEKTRRYPVEMPYVFNITYECKLQLPDGYNVEDTMLPPASVRFDNNALYKNIVNYDSTTNTLKAYSILKTEKTEFSIEDYSGFKYFFDKMLEKQQKTLVIKKL